MALRHTKELKDHFFISNINDIHKVLYLLLYMYSFVYSSVSSTLYRRICNEYDSWICSDRDQSKKDKQICSKFPLTASHKICNIVCGNAKINCTLKVIYLQVVGTIWYNPVANDFPITRTSVLFVVYNFTFLCLRRIRSQVIIHSLIYYWLITGWHSSTVHNSITFTT